MNQRTATQDLIGTIREEHDKKKGNLWCTGLHVNAGTSERSENKIRGDLYKVKTRDEVKTAQNKRPGWESTKVTSGANV